MEQPFLHELVTCVRAPSTLLSDRDGQVRPGGVQGWFRHDVRQLSELVVALASPSDPQELVQPEGVGSSLEAAWSARFVGVSRRHGDPIADPTVRVDRRRDLDMDRLVERVVLVHDGRRDQRLVLEVRVAADHAPVPRIRSGELVGHGSGVVVTTSTQRLDWRSAAGSTSMRCTPLPDDVTREGACVVLRWHVELAARTSWQVELVATGNDVAEPVLGPGSAPLAVEVTSARAAVPRLVARSVADLAGLTAAFRDRPADVFATAGSPWYLTLFGRDALWTARFALPLGTRLAGGTLRAMASRQGSRHDPVTGEQPGKILHEIRGGPGITGHELPPVYYGTVDATPLWVSLLHDAWRWGLPDAEVRSLLPHLDRALDWVLLHADADGDALAEYVDESGTGLANQGWKDSTDAVQHADGSLAVAPLALCEAQAYIVKACLDAAALLEVVDPSSVTRHRCHRLREHAARVAEAFRSSFWVEDARGRFPALALDHAKRPVACATSNLGHLLATGLLDPGEEQAVATRLRQPDLDCGRGLRTLSGDHPYFNPIGYHTGSVWPHDTAIAVLGLARSGHDDVAASLAAGLVDSSDRYEGRLPELFGGTGLADPVLDYPASCRPQAWSAAAAIALLQAALGLEVDLAAGAVTVAPRAAFAGWFPLTVRRLTIAGRDVEVSVDGDGVAVVRGAQGLRVRTGVPT
jgi:hypothetical protein